MSLLIDQLTPGGTIDYDGAGGPLIGTNIVFEEITGLNTPLNSGDTLTLTDGRLNFETGINTQETPFWVWTGGGYFTLTADTVTDPSNNQIISGDDVVLLSGVFVANEFGIAAIGTLTTMVPNPQIAINGFGIDQKHEDLLSYFGIDPIDFIFANSEITAAAILSGNGFTASVLEADITNSPIPEPSTYVLGMIAGATLLAFRRRLLKR